MRKTANFKGFIDTTLREGQQSPLLFDSRKYRFNIEDKKTISSEAYKEAIELIHILN